MCDRFTDASFAYQGGGRGVPLALLSTLEWQVQQGRQPDLTLWFDLPPEVAAARRAAARDPDRFERQDEAFFARVREGYAHRSRAAAERFVRVDAMQPVDAVRAQLEGTLESRGW
jgi:dTMP kinase